MKTLAYRVAFGARKACGARNRGVPILINTIKIQEDPENISMGQNISDNNVEHEQFLVKKQISSTESKKTFDLFTGNKSANTRKQLQN